MLILASDTSGKSLSVALCEEENIIAEATLNLGYKHSVTYQPLVADLLTRSGRQKEEINLFVCATGPGSFTGIRIGVSTARGLAQGLSIPAVGVLTLEALAEAVSGPGLLICPLLDARRGEVYGALYRRQDKSPYRLEELVPPGAMKLELLLAHAAAFKRPVIFLGEGLKTYGDQIGIEMGPLALLAPLSLDRAALIAWRGKELLKSAQGLTYERVLPVYLRLPEAERKLKLQKPEMS